MKTTNPVSADDSRTVSLSALADACIKEFIGAAKSNLTSITNNVNDKLCINGDDNVVGNVICSLIKALITHTRESQVFITARELYGRTIEINVKDDNCFNAYAVALSLQEVVPMVEKMGGEIDINNRRQSMTSISFRFPLEKSPVLA